MGIAWKREFAIGVDEIDGQHQELFSRLNRLFRAMAEGREAKEVAELFLFLDDYTRAHFTAEEEFQARIGYPHLAMHREEHRHFLKELANLREKLASDGATPEVVRLVSQVLQQWLVGHICQVDRVLGDYLNTHRNAEWQQWLKDHF
jgi:hemerythrin